MSLLSDFVDTVTSWFSLEEEKPRVVDPLKKAVTTVNPSEVDHLLKTTTHTDEELEGLEALAKTIYPRIPLAYPTPGDQIRENQKLSEIIFLLHKKRFNLKDDYLVVQSLLRGEFENGRQPTRPLVEYSLGVIGPDNLNRFWQDSVTCVAPLFAHFSNHEISSAILAGETDETKKDLVELKVHVMHEYRRISYFSSYFYDFKKALFGPSQPSESDQKKLNALSAAICKNTAKPMITALKMHRSNSIFNYFHQPDSYSNLPAHLVEKFDDEPSCFQSIKRFFK